MKKKVYMVRHGQTIYNRKDLCQGMCDSPLSDLGKKQARATGRYFRSNHICFDRVYCSPLYRTEQTLREITDAPFWRIDGLRELDFGDFEGVPNSLHRVPKEERQDVFQKAHAETRSACRSRILATMNALAKENDKSETLLVITHGCVMMDFLEAAGISEETDHDHFSNCMIFDLDYEDGCWKKNQIINAHLKNLEEDAGVEKILRALEEEKRKIGLQSVTIQDGSAA